jgi:2-amino-4-hydroxy-6-hydroxymethyldihydropteridine diphosphokinase
MIFAVDDIALLSWLMKKHRAYLCIGGNLGERLENLEETRDFVLFNMGDIIQESPIYQSSAWGMEGAPDFLNQVLEIETELTPEQLLAEIEELEEFYGRERKDNQYLNREMDVDILFFGDEPIETEALSVPHPRMHERKFVLQPLNDIAADLVHPVLKLKISELLAKCTDEGKVSLYVEA